MKDVTFHSAWPDGDALYEYEPTLFHLPDHLMLQCHDGWLGFYAFDEKRRRIIASFFANIRDHQGTSAVRSPYGGIECAPHLPADIVFEFIRFCDNALAEVAHEMEIKLPPEAYAPTVNPWIFSFLHSLGFRTTGADLSACIPVSGDFAGAIRKTESQILNKAIQAGHVASLMAGDKLQEAYEFISLHHREKKYSVSMTWEQLRNTATLFPGRYLTFAVHDGDVLIAAAIAIRVSSRVLSLFYIDHNHQYDKLSPPVLLIAALYDYCAMNHIPLLDLGTSSLPDGPNLGLLSFKMRMGAQASVKPTLRKLYRHV